MDPLISVDDLAGFLQKPLDRYSATLCITGASGIVRTYCGWNLSRITETLIVDSPGGTSVNLPSLRINDLTEVRVDGDVIDPATYGWAVNGVLACTTGYLWSAGLRAIEADVDHGYDASEMPDEICIVVAAMAGRLYSNPEGLTQRSTGDDNRTFGVNMSDLEMRLISAYRLI